MISTGENVSLEKNEGNIHIKITLLKDYNL